MENHIETIRLLAKYPQAIRARASNIKVGDVLCNHVDVPCVYLTEDRHKHLTNNSDLLDWMWIIART